MTLDWTKSVNMSALTRGSGSNGHIMKPKVVLTIYWLID